MEAEQRKRLRVITKRAILAAGAVGLYTHRDEIMGHARAYPAGMWLVEVLSDVKERSIRVGGILRHGESGPVLEMDEQEISEEGLLMLEDLFSKERIDDSRSR